ncbi:MAG: hypothetical protein IJ217_01815 [Clostridia bacterium]|nr:hypothetical protein [Clostridia bacterium]
MKKFKIISVVLTLAIIMCMTVSVALAVENSGNGSAGASAENVAPQTMATIGTITNILAVIAGFVCVGKLAQIGIMFMMTGANDKSQAKSAIVPWFIGAIVCGGYAVFGNAIINMMPKSSVLSPGDPTQAINTVGTEILAVLAVLAGAAAVGMLIYIGILYMTKGAGGAAKAKNTLLPWLIGCVIVGGASGLAQTVMNLARGG